MTNRGELLRLLQQPDTLEFLLNHKALDELLEGTEQLIDDGVLAFENNKLTPNSHNIFLVILKHPFPKAAALFLSNIYSAGLLDDAYVHANKNRESILNCMTPYHAGLLFGLLDRAKLNAEPGLAQNNMDILMKYPADDMVFLYQRVQERYILSGAQFTQSIFEEEAGLNVVSNRTNLKDIARDAESAIRPLTDAEERRLEKTTRHYQPFIDKLGGVEPCINLLLQALITRYNQNPIDVEIGPIIDRKTRRVNTLSMRLPVDWDSFMALPLTKENREKALKLYYRHPLHGAYRFFSEMDRPGPWLSPDAEWQSVARFKPLIATLWMAVSDTTEPPIDDYTVNTRIDTFFTQFSEFQRAHNCDKRRERKTAQGAPIYGKDGQVELEYYDDGEADKCGCYIGFKDRAFDAVQGNVYVRGLTLEKVKYELRKFMHQHFKNKISDENRMVLSQAWTSIIAQEPCDPEILASLKSLNVSPTQQKKFLKNFKREHEELRTNSDLIQYIKNAFNDPLFATHAEKFGGATCLHELLIPPKFKRTDSFLANMNRSATASPVRSWIVADSETPIRQYHLVQVL